MNHANATDKVLSFREYPHSSSTEKWGAKSMVQRSARSRFMPNALVFPGGKVDISDSALFDVAKDDEQRGK